jgi:hypothetical protein
MYPYIATPFLGAVTYWGQSNVFGIGAWGSGVLQYQWYKDGVAISGATNATLEFDAIQFTNAGLYSVTVTSDLGTVTNSPSQVIVNSANVSLGIFPGVIINGAVGYSYTIQSTPDLGPGAVWTTLTNITLTSPQQIWNDNSTDTSQPGNPRRFYRVLPQP